MAALAGCITPIASQRLKLIAPTRPISRLSGWLTPEARAQADRLLEGV